MTQSIVEVRGLRFAYSQDGPEVLRGIDLTIADGEYVALIGQNGSGKTTLAKQFSGLLAPVAGEVLIKGQRLTELTVRERAALIGYCYQNPDHQIFLDSIEREVAFGPHNLMLPEEIVASRVEEALRAVGLWEYRHEEPYFAGKGERQKVAVASVLAMRPSLIVLDEPTTGLDWRGSQEMMSLVHQIWEAGHTIIIITHNMRLVAEHAQRVVVLCQGQVLMDGCPSEIFSHPHELTMTYLKPPQITQLWQRLCAAAPAWLNVEQAVENLTSKEQSL
jgi:energy-coupling factor transport system ATP-binding protein